MKIAKIHSAARRYCEERYAYWVKEYTKIRGPGFGQFKKTYSKKELSIFPRYNVLKAILEEIERFTPDDFDDLNEARNLIAEAGNTAENIFTENPTGEIEKRVMDEERKSYIKYINEITDEILDSTPLMPFRKTLSDKESDLIWKRITDIWGIQGSDWYPITGNKPANVEAFEDKYFYSNISTNNLIEALSSQGTNRIWELREYGAEYEIVIELFNPYYNGAEGYWTSDSLDWLLYCSHESSITVGGWLLDEIKKLWPFWRKHIWMGPFFK